MHLLERWALAVVAVVAAAIAHPVCNLFFRCGCDLFGPAHCNIHQAAGPHCPWCTHPWAFPLVGAGWMGAAMLGAALGRRAFGRRAASTIACAFVGLFVGMLASGAATILVSGYPHFL